MSIFKLKIKLIITIILVASELFYSVDCSLALGLANNNIAMREEERIYEVYSSNNHKYMIYSRVNKQQIPEIYLFQNKNRYQTKHRQITNNSMVEISPVVNNKGIYAYVAFDAKDNSIIYVNGKVIRMSNKWGYYKGLAINNSYLLAIYETYNNQHYLFLYNLINSSLKFFPIKKELHPEKLQFIDGGKVLIQAYNRESKSMDIFIFDILKGQLRPLIISPQTEVLEGLDYKDETYTIHQLAEGGDNLKLLYNGYHYLYKQPSCIALSGLNDFSGMLSWNVAYRLEGLIKLYQLTKDEKIKQQIRRIVANMLLTTNEHNPWNNRDNPDYLWASKKYSKDKLTPISFMVNNARIYYPLLLACNQDLLDARTKSKILINAERMFSYYEQYYNKTEKLYHFPGNISYWADGLWLPFNQQNTLGLVMIELYKNTKDKEYKKRIFELAAKFREEMEYQPQDKRLIWHYWPRIFYQGWGRESKISRNTPVKDKTYNTLYEDINHAGINVKFILGFNREFNQKIFKEQELNGVSKTLDYIINNGFSPFLDSRNEIPVNAAGKGQTRKRVQGGYSFLPQYGWVELENQKLKKLYLNLLPQTSMDFISYMDLYSNVSLINTTQLKQEKLLIRSLTFNKEHKLVNSRVITLNVSNLAEYFKNVYP